MRRVSVALLLISIGLTGCFPFKALFYGAPDKKDIERFRKSEILAGEDCFEFVDDVNGLAGRIKVNEWSSGTPLFVGLDELAQNHETRSMLIIRNDTLLYQYYGEQTDSESLHASYSVAKSFTSALIGIAIDEGLIPSVDEPVVNYIDELKSVPMAEQLKVSHLLNMTSGIKLKLPIDAIIYYGNRTSRALKKIEFESKPGTRQQYLNINVHLLGIIIKRATGKTPSEYLSEKIWKKIGMCNDATWTTDKDTNDLTFCCMGASALDYAKFGRLFLNKGNWNGEQIISEEWVDESIRRDTTEGSSFGYNYLWHIGEKAYGDYMADGMYKQNIYVNPEKKVIIVLMCNREKKLKSERVRWRHVFREIVDQL